MNEEQIIEISCCSIGFDYCLKIIDEIGCIDYNWSPEYTNNYCCKRCGNSIVDSYGEIIMALIKAGLLKKEFELKCCVCYRKEEKGRNMLWL
jgi:hypothetical protein